MRSKSAHLQTLTTIAVAALGLAVAAGAQDLSKIEIKTEKVADNVYMLAGRGGNLGVSVGDDGVFLIDDDYAPLTDKIKAAIAELSDKPIRFVLNTHWHSDHTGGNENLGKGGTLIVAHENVRKSMSVDQFIEALKMPAPASPAVALPVITYNDAVTFHVNGDEIHAFHVPPSHTDGDSVVHFRKADVVHMGDIFFNGLYPFIDTQNGGSLDGMVAVGEMMLEKVGDTTKIIPGHGPLATKADFAGYVDMLKAARAKIAPLVEAGKTVEEVVAAKPTAELDEQWANGFLSADAWVAIVYAGFKSE